MAQKATNRASAIDGRTTRHPGYAVSQIIRKRIEESFAWIKTIAGLHKTKHRGVGRVAFSWDQQVMGSDAGSAQLLGFDDRTMMSEGGAKDCEAQVHWHGDQLRR